MRLSIAQRLALMFALAALLVFTLLGFGVYSVLERQVMRYQRAELETKLHSVSGSVAMCDSQVRWAKVREKVANLISGDRDTQVWAWSPDANFRIGDAPPSVRAAGRGDGGMGTLARGSEQLRTLHHHVPGHGERPAVDLWIGIDDEPYAQALQRFSWALWVAGVLGVLLVAGLGYWIARLGLRPLRALSNEARALSPQRLSQRLRATALPAELGHLTHAFNGALDRLEAAYTRLDGFNADVAHELRTPLANLMGQTQVALSRPRDRDALQEVLQSNLEELERLRAIVNDMLFLSRAGQGDIAVDTRQLQLADEVAKAGEFLEFLFEEAQLGLRIEGDAQACIDPSLFRRALTNLLHNAVQHAQPGSDVRVLLTSEGQGARIAVVNQGREIAGEHLPLLFERFYRVDAAREYQGERHHGLGLSIVKAIAALHGGEVFASSAGGQTTVGFGVARRAPA
ncbi:heavy metal sensor histidine kinase [Stenotrophomonas sp. 24(2023)]|uniref:heavy metal sensor histidine kinase n=1 Tax=Stenotrophomonas sp. 24(2023) TaxID=3068324 RepID=UPI0027DFAA17|nr:heavy metal sensor histidine kinase [Stenotrophomonas sp. 24(2023)]WMJ69374.1 heavy metal sensor histidine kinase [Stenotrophomonas sp. 24(2023)]